MSLKQYMYDRSNKVVKLMISRETMYDLDFKQPVELLQHSLVVKTRKRSGITIMVEELETKLDNTSKIRHDPNTCEQCVMTNWIRFI